MINLNSPVSRAATRLRAMAQAVFVLVALGFCAQSGRYTGTTSEGLPFWLHVTPQNAVDSFHVTYNVYNTRGSYLYRASSTTFLYTPISIVNNSFSYLRTTSDTLLFAGMFSGSTVSGTFYKSTYNTSAYQREASGRLTYNAAYGTAPVPPTIASHLVNITVNEGQTATFTVTATGTAPLSYQWQKGTTDITGATAASYTTPVTTMADNGATFRCVVTNTGGSATSNAAMLTVNAVIAPPLIAQQPQDTSVTEGDALSLAVSATGSGLTYQWQTSSNNGASWSDINGAQAATYTKTALAIDNNKKFRCTVSNTGGSIVSSAATTQILQLDEYYLTSSLRAPVVMKISPRTGALCAQFQVPEPVSGIAFSGDLLYVGSDVSPRIFVVDPATGRQTRSPYIIPTPSKGIAFGDGYLWTINTAGLAYKIDPVSGTVVRSIPAPRAVYCTEFLQWFSLWCGK